MLPSNLTRLPSLLFVLLFVVVTILGTYGTANQGLNFSGTIFVVYGLILWLVLAVLIILYQSYYGRGMPTKFLFSRYLQLFLLMLVFLLVSTLNFPEKLFTSSFIVILSIISVLAILSSIKTELAFQNWFFLYQIAIYATCWLALISGLYSMFNSSISIGPFLIEYNILFFRMNSWFNNSTMMGLFFFHGTVSAYYLLLKGRNWLFRCVNTISILAFLSGMALSGGRTAVIVMLVAVCALLVVKVSTRILNLVFLFTASIPIALLASVFLRHYEDSIYILRRFTASDIYSLGGRLSFYADAQAAIGEASMINILFGFGITGVTEKLDWPYGAHSGLVRILLEYGLLVFLLLIILQVSILARLACYMRKNSAYQFELQALFASWFAFAVAETMVIQLLGVDFFYVLFLATFSFILIAFHFIENAHYLVKR